MRERNIINDKYKGWRLALYQAFFPTAGYWRSEEHPWMLLKIYDGTWEVDVDELFKQEKVKEQLRQLRQHS